MLNTIGNKYTAIINEVMNNIRILENEANWSNFLLV